MPNLRSLVVLALAGSTLHAAEAATHVVDFSNVPTGHYVNGTSFGGVAFANSGAQATFYVNDYGASSWGQGLETHDTGAVGAGGVMMRFAAPQSAMNLLFGNDDPSTAPPGALAVLQVSLGEALVGQVTLAMNRDDVANQVISFSGQAFDSALFYMADADGQSLAHFSEVIDNVTYSDVAAPVPEPGKAALMALGLSAVGLCHRGRRRRSN